MLTRRRNNRGPYNPPLRVAGDFVKASSQSLSVASNSTLQTGDVDFWVSAWFNANSLAANDVVASSFSTTPATSQWILQLNASTVLRFTAYSGSSQLSAVQNVAAGSWYHCFGYHDATADLVGLLINGTGGTTATGGLATNSTASPFTISGFNGSAGSLFFDGRIECVAFGKSLPGGFATTPAATIAATLYNGGRPLDPRRVSIEQRTAWGGVSAWISNNLTTDVWGTNTLTPNNAPRTVQVLS